MFEGLPNKVLKAILGDNKEALSAMGKKGAERAADIKDFQKEKATKEQVADALERAKSYSVNDEGDVLPPDPKTIEELKEGLH